MASRRADPQRPPLESRGDCAPHGHWEFLHAASPPKPAASAGTASLERKTPDPTLVGLKTNQLTFWTHQRMWVPRIGGSGEEPQKSGRRARMIFLVGNVAQRSVEIRPGGSGPAYCSHPPSPTDNDARASRLLVCPFHTSSAGRAGRAEEPSQETWGQHGDMRYTRF